MYTTKQVYKFRVSNPKLGIKRINCTAYDYESAEPRCIAFVENMGYAASDLRFIEVEPFEHIDFRINAASNQLELL